MVLINIYIYIYTRMRLWCHHGAKHNFYTAHIHMYTHCWHTCVSRIVVVVIILILYYSIYIYIYYNTLQYIYVYKLAATRYQATDCNNTECRSMLLSINVFCFVFIKKWQSNKACDLILLVSLMVNLVPVAARGWQVVVVVVVIVFRMLIIKM